MQAEGVIQVQPLLGYSVALRNVGQLRPVPMRQDRRHDKRGL